MSKSATSQAPIARTLANSADGITSPIGQSGFPSGRR
jgi:hypothetical protein